MRVGDALSTLGRVLGLTGWAGLTGCIYLMLCPMFLKRSLVGWYDTDWLGIDNGPVVSVAENFRTGMIWNLMRKNTTIIRGLRRADFRGGWLKTAPQ